MSVQHNLFALSTLYETLGVTPIALQDEVKNAYRKLAREYHPDINPDPKAHDRMAQINVAFEVLSDPVRRMEYDASIGNHSAKCMFVCPHSHGIGNHPAEPGNCQ